MFRLLGWTLQACGLYFRTLYKHGCFLSNAEAQIAVESGWKTLDPGILSGLSIVYVVFGV